MFDTLITLCAAAPPPPQPSDPHPAAGGGGGDGHVQPSGGSTELAEHSSRGVGLALVVVLSVLAAVMVLFGAVFYFSGARFNIPQVCGCVLCTCIWVGWVGGARFFVCVCARERGGMLMCAYILLYHMCLFGCAGWGGGRGRIVA